MKHFHGCLAFGQCHTTAPTNPHQHKGRRKLVTNVPGSGDHTQTRRSNTNYCHELNRFDLGKMSLFYYQLKYVWTLRNKGRLTKTLPPQAQFYFCLPNSSTSSFSKGWEWGWGSSTAALQLLPPHSFILLQHELSKGCGFFRKHPRLAPPWPLPQATRGISALVPMAPPPPASHTLGVSQLFCLFFPSFSLWCFLSCLTRVS